MARLSSAKPSALYECTNNMVQSCYWCNNMIAWCNNRSKKDGSPHLQHVCIVPSPRAGVSREPLGALQVVHDAVPCGADGQADVLRCPPCVPHLHSYSAILGFWLLYSQGFDEP